MVFVFHLTKWYTANKMQPAQVTCDLKTNETIIPFHVFALHVQFSFLFMMLGNYLYYCQSHCVPNIVYFTAPESANGSNS